MAEVTMFLHAECDELMAVLDELKTLELPEEVRQAFLDLGNDWSQLVRTESHTTPGADITVTFHPSDRLLALVAAARAGSVN